MGLGVTYQNRIHTLKLEIEELPTEELNNSKCKRCHKLVSEGSMHKTQKLLSSHQQVEKETA